MALPSAVKAQAEAAEAKMRAQAETEAEEPAEVEETPDTPAPKPVEKDSFEQKYHVLQGKYNAEVPRLTQQIRDLERTVSDLKTQLEQQQQAKPEPIADPSFDVLREDYGDEFVKPLEQLSAQNAALVAELQQLKAQLSSVQGTQKQTVEQVFIERLSAAVPEWESINTDSAFHAWLSEPDGLSGKTRQNALDEAGQALNAQQVITIFQAFLKAKPSKDGRKKDVERQIAPPSNSSESLRNNDKQIYPLSEVSRFYKEAATKKLFQTNPKLYEQKNREYSMAQAEGRIDPNR